MLPDRVAEITLKQACQKDPVLLVVRFVQAQPLTNSIVLLLGVQVAEHEGARVACYPGHREYDHGYYKKREYC